MYSCIQEVEVRKIVSLIIEVLCKSFCSINRFRIYSEISIWNFTPGQAIYKPRVKVTKTFS
jgi:hypothetical protein